MSAEFVQAFTTAAREAIAARGMFRGALTGGSAATSLYPQLANADIDWPRCEFFVSDERCVPANHPDSNAEQISKALPRATIQRVRTELSPGEAAADYARRLPDQLDLIHTGMGPDGHVASLFPGSASLAEHTARVISIEHAPKPPPQRVTFTLKTFSEARAVWFLVVGAAKHAVAELARTDSTSLLPAALVHRASRAPRWFLLP